MQLQADQAETDPEVRRQIMFDFEKENAIRREGREEGRKASEREAITNFVKSFRGKNYPEEEIRKIAAAQALAEEAFQYLLPRLEVGRSEISVAAELEYYMKLHGAEGPSFSTICVSGTRSSLPHGTPTQSLLESGTFITLDFGCMLDGYASDMTRTVCLGKASDLMKKVYQTVLSAQLAGIAAVKSGVPGKAVDRAARSVIEEAGYGEYFGHSTGHGIGLEVHESPSAAPKTETALPAGSLISVEPGIYLPGTFGVRIEDLVVVREGGSENLNRTSKELLEL
jgi:Xaa-Pro aminopeptidase